MGIYSTSFHQRPGKGLVKLKNIMGAEDAERWLREGLDCLAREDAPGAVELLARALTPLKERDDPVLLVVCLNGLQRAAMATGNLDRAMQALRELLKLVEKGPAAGKIHLQRAELLIRLGRYGEGREEAEKALDMFKGNQREARALIILGLALLKEGREEEALVRLGRMKKIAQEDRGLIYALQGVGLCLLGRHWEAVAVLESAGDCFAPNTLERNQVYLSLAMAMINSSQADEALITLQLVGNDQKAVYYLRAEAFLQAAALLSNGWGLATGALTTGLAEEQRQPETELAAFYNLLQVCSEGVGDFAAARDWFRRPGIPVDSPFLIKALTLMAQGLVGAVLSGPAKKLVAKACHILKKEVRAPRDGYLLDSILGELN